MTLGAWDSGIQLDSALLIGLGTIAGGLIQAVIQVVREHQTGAVQHEDQRLTRLDKRVDDLISRQEAEIKRLEEDRAECREHLDEAFQQIVELRQRVMEINTRWGRPHIGPPVPDRHEGG